MTDDVDSLAGEIARADTTVALTGAGVSTASGIPTFRGEDGIWNEFDPKSFHRRRLDADPDGFWRDRLELRVALLGDSDPEPNAAHTALAELEAEGTVDAVVTQNVDGLHTDAGSDGRATRYSTGPPTGTSPRSVTVAVSTAPTWCCSGSRWPTPSSRRHSDWPGRATCS